MAVPKNVIVRTLSAAALASGLVGGVVSAQEAGADVVTEIIVEAPRSVPLPVERSPFTGAPIVTSTVRIPVLFDDLDLTQPRDQARLMTRVERVARDVCRELDRIHPFSPDPDCPSKAIGSGETAARAAISAAKGVE